MIADSLAQNALIEAFPC